MLSALRKIASRLWTANHSGKSTEVPLFSGSAYFSNRVPKTLTDIWVAHGGEISSGAKLDPRARYFFATDPSDPWVTKLLANSVVVIHVGWIVHCIEEAFIVPIADYILDDRFIPGFPYELTACASGVSALLYEPGSRINAESGRYSPEPSQTPDTPSTPTSVPRKRGREEAYFDSPSGSLVLSAFGKDGLPRRPRKLRKLRFDPSFSPRGGKPSDEMMQVPGLDWFQDHDADTEDELYKGHRSTDLLARLATLHTPDTPTSNGPTTAFQHSPTCEHAPDPTRVSPPVAFVGMEEKIPVRAIDFTNLPLPTRRRFPMPQKPTKSKDTCTMLSIMRAENAVKTPKKISFADHARVCVYPASPQRPCANDSTARGIAQQRMGDELEANDEAQMSNKDIKSYFTPSDSAPQLCSLEMNDENPWRHREDRSVNDALTLTMEDVKGMRCRLLELVAADGVDDSQLATLFELGKTFRGMAFRHVW